jgi:hypothetical protein
MKKTEKECSELRLDDRVIVFPLTISLGVVGLFIFIYIIYSEHNNLNNFLHYLSEIKNYEIKVDQKSTDYGDRIIHELKQTRIVSAHHSHPTKTIIIEIKTDTDSKIIKLGRDSQTFKEYWVFTDGSSREIGRINTDYFDNY